MTEKQLNKSYFAILRRIEGNWAVVKKLDSLEEAKKELEVLINKDNKKGVLNSYQIHKVEEILEKIPDLTKPGNLMDLF